MSGEYNSWDIVTILFLTKNSRITKVIKTFIITAAAADKASNEYNFIINITKKIYLNFDNCTLRTPENLIQNYPLFIEHTSYIDYASVGKLKKISFFENNQKC